MGDTAVSVVIPYAPEFSPEYMLEAAKDSAREQDVPVDLVVVRDSELRGPSWARNRGLERATTRYVAFLDADDRWFEDKLRRQLDEMEQTGCGLCVQGPPIETDTFVRELYLGNIQSLTSSIVVDTSTVDVTFDEDLSRREDHLFMLEAAVQSGVCTCADLFDVGRHEESYSADLSILRRFQKDKEFAETVRDRVPEVRQLLNDHFDSVHCDDEPTTNTPGDLFRLWAVGAGLHTYPYLAMSVLCQRL